MVGIEYSEAIVEVLDILEHSEQSIVSKIPKRLMDFFEENKSKTYKVNLDHSKAIDKMDLKSKTRDIISMIYLNYLCDEKEKQELRRILKENEKELQEEARKKYNPENIFKSEKTENKTAIIEIKENFFRKLIRKIKETLHI